MFGRPMSISNKFSYWLPLTKRFPNKSSEKTGDVFYIFSHPVRAYERKNIRTYARACCETPTDLTELKDFVYLLQVSTCMFLCVQLSPTGRVAI